MSDMSMRVKNGSSNLCMYTVVPRNDMLRILGRNLAQVAGLCRGKVLQVKQYKDG